MGYPPRSTRPRRSGPGRTRLTNQDEPGSCSHTCDDKGYEALSDPLLRSIRTCRSIAEMGNSVALPFLSDVSAFTDVDPEIIQGAEKWLVGQQAKDGHWQPRYGYDDSGAYRVHCRHSGRIAAIDTTPLTQFRNLSNWQLRNMVACTGCSNTTLRSTAGDMQVASRVPRWQS